MIPRHTPLATILAIAGLATAGLAAAQPADQPTVVPSEVDPPSVSDAPAPEPTELAPSDRPDAESIDAPPASLAPAALARINAPFLTDTERADLRVTHGLWVRDDLLEPARLARVLRITRAWSHPSFDRDQPPSGVPERLAYAEACLHRGDPAAALAAAEGIDNPDALRILGHAHELLGDQASAIDAYQRAADSAPDDPDADEPASVRAALALYRLRAPEQPEPASRALLDRITRARDADRLNPDARLVEAELLYARHNLSDAQAAAREALRLNPRNAGALRVLGEIAVDGFDFDTAEQIAAALDELAATGTPDNASPAISPDATALRARAALRRRDPDAARSALADALESYPARHELLALQAATHAAGYDTRSARELLERIDARSPGNPDAWLRVGSTLAEARQYGLADDFLREAIQRSPDWSRPRLERGLMLVQAGRDTDARAELTEALRLDPFDLRAQNSLTLVTELATYNTIETEHFIVRYKPGIDAALAPEMATALEAMHERVTSDRPGGVDFEPAARTVIELMPNHEWFAVRIGGMPSIHTMAASTGPVIAIESPQVGPKFTIGPFDWRRVLQHEYTHTVNLARTRNRVIHWMTEANAVFNEDAPRDMRTWTLLASAYESDELFDLDAINIAFVRPEKPTDRALAYAQGAWMFEYIVERWGPEAPRRIMDLSATGRSSTAAFEEALGETPASFLEAFRPWARAQLSAHGLLLPEGTPTVEALLAEALRAADQDADNPAAPSTPPEEVLDALLEAHPDHPGLLEYKVAFALVNAEVRLTDEQLALLRRLAELRPVDDAPHRRLARHYLAGEALEERLGALPHLEFLDAREINSPAYAAELAELYARTDRFDLAHASADRASSIAPFDATLREQAARYALLAGAPDDARRHLLALTIIEPDRDIHRRRLEAFENQYQN